MNGPGSAAGNRLIFLIAGEPSGDALGAGLMRALRRTHDGPVRFEGVGGERMKDEGLESLFPMSDLAVMGVLEVAPRLPRLLRRLGETVGAIKHRHPSALVTIDSPDFCLRVARRVKGEGIPLVHYVAPTVWAWRRGRARKMARFLDHLLALLPFEPPYFEEAGLPCTFVGHPVVEAGADRGDGLAFRRHHGIDADAPVIAVLPGSRASEVRHHLPEFAGTLERLGAVRPALHAVVATVAEVEEEVRAAAGRWAVPATVVLGTRDKYDAFAASDVALAASGTVALELALAAVPAVVAYRMNPVTSWLARRLIDVKYVHIANLVLDREAVPEFLLDRCRAEHLVPAIERLLDDEIAANAQTAAVTEALVALGLGEPSPNTRAANVVMRIIEDRERSADTGSRTRSR